MPADAETGYRKLVRVRDGESPDRDRTVPARTGTWPPTVVSGPFRGHAANARRAPRSVPAVGAGPDPEPVEAARTGHAHRVDGLDHRPEGTHPERRLESVERGRRPLGDAL